MDQYINATEDGGKDFYKNFNDKGKIVMLNLLRFKEKADYSNLKQIKPNGDITGKEAYQLYMESTVPVLKKAGSRVIYYGASKNFLIGPESENWDALVVVEHQSVLKFMEFAQNKEYLKNAGHRTAALEDSRLLPSHEIKNYS